MLLVASGRGEWYHFGFGRNGVSDGHTILLSSDLGFGMGTPLYFQATWDLGWATLFSFLHNVLTFVQPFSDHACFSWDGHDPISDHACFSWDGHDPIVLLRHLARPCDEGFAGHGMHWRC